MFLPCTSNTFRHYLSPASRQWIDFACTTGTRIPLANTWRSNNFTSFGCVFFMRTQINTIASSGGKLGNKVLTTFRKRRDNMLGWYTLRRSRWCRACIGRGGGSKMHVTWLRIVHSGCFLLWLGHKNVAESSGKRDRRSRRLLGIDREFLTFSPCCLRVIFDVARLAP